MLTAVSLFSHIQRTITDGDVGTHTVHVVVVMTHVLVVMTE